MVNSTYVGSLKEGKSAKQTAVFLFFFFLWFLLSANPTREWMCQGEMGAAGRVGVRGVGAELPGGCASLGPHSAVFEEQLGEGATASRGHEWPKSRAPPLLPSFLLSHSQGARSHLAGDDADRAARSPWKRYSSALSRRHHRTARTHPRDNFLLCRVPDSVFFVSPLLERRFSPGRARRGRVSACRRTLPPQVPASPSLASAWLQGGQPTLSQPRRSSFPSPASALPFRNDTGAEKTKKPRGQHRGGTRQERIPTVVGKGRPGEPQLALFIKENEVPRARKIWGLLTQKSTLPPASGERLRGSVELKSLTWHQSVEYGMNIHPTGIARPVISRGRKAPVGDGKKPQASSWPASQAGPGEAFLSSGFPVVTSAVTKGSTGCTQSPSNTRALGPGSKGPPVPRQAS